jgi:1,4-alpha-glucan branching enzyme
MGSIPATRPNENPKSLIVKILIQINIKANMSIKKQFNKKEQLCKVTFSLAKEKGISATNINLAGDFNNWDMESIPMKKNKVGEFSASLDLKQGAEYEFKYIIDGWEWLNEPDADKLVSNVYYSNNSVIIL